MGLEPRTLGSWPETKAEAQPPEPPRHPFLWVFSPHPCCFTWRQMWQQGDGGDIQEVCSASRTGPAGISPSRCPFCFPCPFSWSGSHLVLPNSVQWSPFRNCSPAGILLPFPVCATVLPCTVALTIIVRVPTNWRTETGLGIYFLSTLHGTCR